MEVSPVKRWSNSPPNKCVELHTPHTQMFYFLFGGKFGDLLTCRIWKCLPSQARRTQYFLAWYRFVCLGSKTRSMYFIVIWTEAFLSHIGCRFFVGYFYGFCRRWSPCLRVWKKMTFLKILQISPIISAVGMVGADIAPEHVSAEAQHLQNIKKGEIASEYISEAVQPQVSESKSAFLWQICMRFIFFKFSGRIGMTV